MRRGEGERGGAAKGRRMGDGRDGKGCGKRGRRGWKGEKRIGDGRDGKGERRGIRMERVRALEWSGARKGEQGRVVMGRGAGKEGKKEDGNGKG